MVAGRAEIASNAVGGSLARQVQHLIDERSHPWLNSLIARDASQPNSPSSSPQSNEVVDLNTNFSIDRNNADMAASRLARILWPAIKAHSRSYEGDTASVVINSADQKELDRAAQPFSETLGIDLPRLWFDIKKGLKRIELETDKSTLYTIQLGDVSYKMISLVCPKEPSDWARFRQWREEIKEKYDVHMLIAAASPQKGLLEQSANSQISPTQLSAKTASYYRFERQNEIPHHLRNRVSDWRDIQFLSVDDGNTKRPEDKFNVTRKADDVMSFKGAIPLVGNPRLFFEPFKDLYCGGCRMLVNAEGEPLAFRTELAFTHNTAPIDSYSANQIGNRIEVSPESSYHNRIQQIRENGELTNQILNLYELANRILKRQYGSGAAVSVELNSGMQKPSEGPRRMQSEFMVSTILNYTQQLMARWALQSDSAPSLIALRPHFRNSRELDAVREMVPWMSDADLHKPASRNAAARQLIQQDRPDLASRFADIIRYAHRHRHLVAVHSASEIMAEDNFRFKAMKSLVGNANNLQLSHVLTGSPSLDRSSINSMVSELNSKHFRRSSTVSRNQELIEETIRIKNTQAFRILQGG